MQTSPAELTRAVKLLSMGELLLAERSARIGLVHHPDHGGLYQVRGIARHLLGRPAQSVHDLESAQALIPLNPLAVWALAEGYVHFGHRTLARDLLTSLIGRTDCTAALLPRVAQTLRRMDELDLALRVCEKWSVEFPTQATAYWGIAYFMARLGFPIDAVADRLEKAYRLAPNRATYRAQFGLVLATAGDADRARAVLIDLAPEVVRCPHLSTRVARAWEMIGDYVHAQVWSDHAVSQARLSSGTPLATSG